MHTIKIIYECNANAFFVASEIVCDNQWRIYCISLSQKADDKNDDEIPK